MSVVSEKERRENAIFDLIKERVIGTQGELVEALLAVGFEVTQATVSRDIRRLELVKKPLPAGGYRYSAPSLTLPKPKTLNTNSFVTGFSQVEGFCCVNTTPGRAMGIALAIDAMAMPEIAGTLAGDDAVLVMVKNAQDKERVESALRKLI